ncbi:MAG TPA: GNAT family N-acetyltransferase [Thiotrichales bacterium]|nr:GNAT family N-acetyltransferase [Thiotrichales bacterium]
MDILRENKWRVNRLGHFPEIADRWDAINCSAAASPVLESDFVEPLLDSFGHGGVHIAQLGPDNAPLALALVEKRGVGRWATFQPSQAPIGLWVCRPGAEPGMVAEALVPVLPGYVAMLDVTRIDPDLYPRPRDTPRLFPMDYIPTSRIVVEGDYEAFWSARSRNTRQNLKRQRNRLDREGVVTRLEVVTDPLKMEEVVEDYGTLESSGWKGEQGTAVALDNAQGQFYLEMMRRFATRSRAVAFRYWYNTKLAAMDLCVHNGRTMVILKTAYNESLKGSSPGMLMHQEIFEWIFTNRMVAVIEFYGRTLDWHRKWTHDQRSLYHMSVYRHTVFRFLHRDLLDRGQEGNRKPSSEAKK